MDVKSKIRDLIVREFSGNKMINDNTNLFEQEVLDSLGAVRLFLRLEEIFDIIIEQTEIDLKDFMSIDAIVGFVLNSLERKI